MDSLTYGLIDCQFAAMKRLSVFIHIFGCTLEILTENARTFLDIGNRILDQG